MSKGSWRRRKSCTQSEWYKRWDATFGRKDDRDEETTEDRDRRMREWHDRWCEQNLDVEDLKP